MVKEQPNRITTWVESDKKISSEYGDITYLEWCQREVLRIGNCKVREVGGKVALFRA